MKQTAKIISTYTGDTSGVCSALYELGGMVIMHDPSGCNSTYSTHDEPRWYDMDSLIFISALTEKDAIFGNDEKLISDAVNAATELNPRFIAIAGSPVPYMTGCDYNGIALEIENRTGIPCFGFDTDGMRSYVHGASLAFAAYAERMCKECKKSDNLSINILGMTPLDYSVNSSEVSVRKAFQNYGIEVNSVWSMGTDFIDIEHSASAHANVVVSSAGIECANVLKMKFGIPYVVGAPFSDKLTCEISNYVRKCANSRKDVFCFDKQINCDTYIIGESVTSLSLARAIKTYKGIDATVISAVDTPRKVKDYCICATDEDEIIPIIKNAKCIIADPLYKPVCPQNAKFIPLAHEAFSGRIFRNSIPNLIDETEKFINENL